MPLNRFKKMRGLPIFLISQVALLLGFLLFIDSALLWQWPGFAPRDDGDITWIVVIHLLLIVIAAGDLAGLLPIVTLVLTEDGVAKICPWARTTIAWTEVTAAVEQVVGPAGSNHHTRMITLKAGLRTIKVNPYLYVDEEGVVNEIRRRVPDGFGGWCAESGGVSRR